MQGVINYVVAIDNNIPVLGCAKTIDRLTMGGKCTLIDLSNVLKCCLPRLLYAPPGTIMTLCNLQTMSCLHGNDFIANVCGKGKASVLKFFTEQWIGLDPEI